MEEKTDEDVFLQNVPIYTVGYKIILVYFYHFIIFFLALALFWYISTNFLIGVLLVQLLLSCGANVPFIYMFENSNKIREKYTKKDNKFTWQQFFFRYSYTSPLGCAAFYTPLILINYDSPSFQIINMPVHFISNSLFPWYFTNPVSVVLIIIGLLIVRHSKGYDGDMHSYLHIMAPERSKVIKDGILKYIRHPRFLCRFISAFSIGILANNLLAIGVVIIHYVPYYIWMLSIDKELVRMFGKEFETYQNEVPALFPKYGTWKKFLRVLFS